MKDQNKNGIRIRCSKSATCKTRCPVVLAQTQYFNSNVCLGGRQSPFLHVLYYLVPKKSVVAGGILETVRASRPIMPTGTRIKGLQSEHAARISTGCVLGSN